MVLARKKFTSLSSTLVFATLLTGCTSSDQLQETRVSQLFQLLASEDARECRFKTTRTGVHSEIMTRDDSASFVRNLEDICPRMGFALPKASPEQDSQSAVFFDVPEDGNRSSNGSSDGSTVADTSTGDESLGTGSAGGSGSDGDGWNGHNGGGNGPKNASHGQGLGNNGGGNGPENASPGKGRGANDDEI